MELLTYKIDFPISEEILPELKEILNLCFYAMPKERIKIGDLHEKLKNYYNSL